MWIRRKSAKFRPTLALFQSQKDKQIIWGQTTLENNQIFTVWLHKGQVPNPATNEQMPDNLPQKLLETHHK